MQIQARKFHQRHEKNSIVDTYTIFITEKGFYGQGGPIYIVERINLTAEKNFEDGEHILYVNGEYRGDSEIGKLMHDFRCTEAGDMNYNLTAERTRYLKENPKELWIFEDRCGNAGEIKIAENRSSEEYVLGCLTLGIQNSPYNKTSPLGAHR